MAPFQHEPLRITRFLSFAIVLFTLASHILDTTDRFGNRKGQIHTLGNPGRLSPADRGGGYKTYGMCMYNICIVYTCILPRPSVFRPRARETFFAPAAQFVLIRRNPSLSAIRRRAKADNTNTYRFGPPTRRPSKRCGGNSARTQRRIGGCGVHRRECWRIRPSRGFGQRTVGPSYTDARV